MAEGKSKHPGLVKAASDNVAMLKRKVATSGAALKEIIAAAGALQDACADAASGFKDQLGYCEKIIDDYKTKVNEIADLEEQLKEAKGDKNAEKDLLKKHKKADGEADALRDKYNTAVEVYQTLSEVVTGALDRAAAAGKKFEPLSAGARAG